ncbi:hypothetical protein HYC85_012022 [Camellia sinensis]|uniref:Fe2OG dioxygenase domain-containing protein n=1 Tax=Camellia sinensis TaxID=4442 RepID=A0A7J7HBA3_CAMSI|nr:hypothetical protein HYC85_012022 [Camellia sinensis]
MSSTQTHLSDHDNHTVPIVDLSLLHQTDPHTKSLLIDQIHQACLQMGCFQIVNHGISESVIEGALDVNSEFFDMPIANKEELMSDDVYKPVRFRATVQLRANFFYMLILLKILWHYGLIILLITGLHVMDTSGSSSSSSGDGAWRVVPEMKGTLVVLVGDHLQVLSNGIYKSALHRAVPSTDETRLSIASFHSLAMDEVVEPAPELVDEEHPKGYRGSSFQDYINHLYSKKEKTFIETLRLN